MLSKALVSSKCMKSNPSHLAMGRNIHVLFITQTLGGRKCFLSPGWTRSTFEQGNIAGKWIGVCKYPAVIAPTLGNSNSTVVAHIGSRSNRYSDMIRDSLATYRVCQ